MESTDGAKRRKARRIAMIDPEDDQLLELCRAVSEDRGVDWDSACKEMPGLERRLRRLQQIEALGRAHRSIGTAGGKEREAASILFRWGHLEIVEIVGRGSFGDVYRAIDTRLRREVALKLRRTDPGGGDPGARRFLDEARSLARIRHPNVLVVYGADVHDRRAGFWTDFVSGVTLEQRMQRDGPIAPQDALSIGLILCRALAAVHDAGLIHGDLTATNVMREEGGRIVVMDFGASSGRGRTDAGAAFGTPLALAPEVLRGEPPQPASDIYSLGVLLARLVTGRYPIEAQTMEELLGRHERRERTSLLDLRSDLPADVVQAIERALLPEASARYPNAGAMERALADCLQESQTLRSLVDELGRVPEGMSRRIALEVAAAMAAGEHGPLRIETVVMRIDGSIRLPAPGLAREAWATTLRDLGRILYELVAGEPRSDEDNRPAEDAINGASPYLASLIGRLTGPEGVELAGSPRALVRTLTEGEQAAWWREHAREIRRAPRRPIRRIEIPRATSVHGRETDLRRLRELWDHAKAGHARVVLVEGEAGIGKTRLVDEAVAMWEREGEDLCFLSGSFPPGGDSTAAGAIMTAYREHLGEERLEEALREYLACAPRLIRPFAALLRGEGGGAEASVLTKDSLQAAFVQITRALAAERPTIVLIDDLHFAPPEGLALFAALARAVPGHRVLLLGGTRPGLSSAWSAGLLRHEHCSRLELPRLREADVLRIVAEALGSERVAEQVTPALVRRCDGNPLFVLENLRALEESHIITREEGGAWQVTGAVSSLAVPDSIAHLIQARFSGLTADHRDLLDVACCCGFEFDPTLVAEVLAVEILPALRRFSVLERRFGLIHAAGRQYAFDHHQIQEVLHEGLFGPLREQYHARIAAVLERRVAALDKPAEELDGAIATLLCAHYLRGAKGREALRYIRPAIDHLVATFRHAAAAEMLDRALGVPGLVEGRERIDLLDHKSRRLFLLGRPDEEEAALTEMRRLADDAGETLAQARARRMLGALAVRQGRLTEARTVLDEGMRRARACGSLEEEARVSQTLGGLCLEMSRAEEARSLYLASVDLARRIGDRLLEAQGLAAAGVVSQDLGQFEEAEESYRHHLEISRELGDRAGMAIATGNLGTVQLDLERYEDGLPLFREQLEIAREIGFRYGETLAIANLGDLYGRLGRCADALDHNERYLTLAREIGHRILEANALHSMGTTLAILGRWEDCRAMHQRCLLLCREIGHPMTEAHARLGLGSVEEQMGEPGAAESFYLTAHRIWTENPSPQGLLDALLRLGAVRRRLERADEARAILSEALVGARTARMARIEALASCHLALLPEGDAQVALQTLEALESRLPLPVKMETRFLLWKATGDRSHLETAHRLLIQLQENAPKEDRALMIPRVSLYQDIERAWNPPSRRGSSPRSR
jgi:tetratricopeptide (TPR) repeat protein